MTRMSGIKSTVITVLAALLLGASSAAVQAQPSPAAPPPPTPGLRRAPDPAEQAANAQGVVQRGTQLAQRITQLLDEARRETDIIRVTCLNDKLTQTNANLRTAQARLFAFDNATTPEQKNHEGTVLSVLGQKFQVLDQEANRCVGQDLYETGSTKVETEVDTSLLPFEDDVTEPVAPPSTIIVPDTPVLASGIR